MLARTAVFILLSVSVSATEPRQCYWCGPLAEQVHRSTRAPSCDEPSVHITCDPGYMHCAVIATSPPYAESRLCVKLYQDECYSLYCNSTKMWRVTCPCRGDLCNGPNTQREKESFAILSKLVAKSHNTRIKRSLINSSNFINSRKYGNNTNFNQINETINESNETKNDLQSHEVHSKNTIAELQTINNNAIITKTEVSVTNTDNRKTENDDLEKDPQQDTLTQINGNATSTIPITTTDINADTNDTEVLDKITKNRESENDYQETIPQRSKQTQVEDNTDSTVPMTKVTVSLQQEAPTIQLPHPNKEVPTAEALQQSSGLSEKVTETTVTELSTMSVVYTKPTMRTPEATTLKNNTATCIRNCLLILISSIIIQHCI